MAAEQTGGTGYKDWENEITTESIIRAMKSAENSVPAAAGLLGVSSRKLRSVIKKRPALYNVYFGADRDFESYEIPTGLEEVRQTKDTPIDEEVTGQPPPTNVIENRERAVARNMGIQNTQDLADKIRKIGVRDDIIEMLEEDGAFEQYSAQNLAQSLSLYHSMTKIGAVRLFQQFVDMEGQLQKVGETEEKMYIIRTMAEVLKIINQSSDRSISGTNMLVNMLGRKKQSKKIREIK